VSDEVESTEYDGTELDLRSIALIGSLLFSLAGLLYLAWRVYCDLKFDRIMAERWTNISTMRHDVIVAVAPSMNDEGETL